jgi:hypothetical protein
MAHQSLARRVADGVRAAVALFVLVGCGPAAVDKPVQSAPPAAPDGSALLDSSTHWPHFVSTRFGISLSLPDGKNWKIDDHTKPFLWATHEASQSSIVVRAWSDDDLMSRQRCEQKAREMGIFPDAELETVADDHVAEPPQYDTRVWVAIEPRGSRGLGGHVIAVGGFVRRCIFFHFDTVVPSGKEDILSARLALARARIFKGLELGSIDAIERERPSVPH